MKRLLLIGLWAGIVASGCDTLPTNSKDATTEARADPSAFGPVVYPDEVTSANAREKFQALKMEIDKDMLR